MGVWVLLNGGHKYGKDEDEGQKRLEEYRLGRVDSLRQHVTSAFNRLVHSDAFAIVSVAGAVADSNYRLSGAVRQNALQTDKIIRPL